MLLHASIPFLLPPCCLECFFLVCGLIAGVNFRRAAAAVLGSLSVCVYWGFVLMGCTASKTLETMVASKDEPGHVQYGHSVSVPAAEEHHYQSKNDSNHMVALKSSTYGILKTDPPPLPQQKQVEKNGHGRRSQSSTAAEIYEKLKNYDVADDMVMKPWSEVSLSLPKLPPVAAAAVSPSWRVLGRGEPEMINTWELMDGLEEDSPGSASFEQRKSSRNTTGLSKVKPFEKSRTLPLIRTVDDLDSVETAQSVDREDVGGRFPGVSTGAVRPGFDKERLKHTVESSPVQQTMGLKSVVQRPDQGMKPLAEGSTKLKPSPVGFSSPRIATASIRQEDNKAVKLSLQSLSPRVQTQEFAATMQEEGSKLLLLPRSAATQSPSPRVQSLKSPSTEREHDRAYGQFHSPPPRRATSEAAVLSQERGKVFPYPMSPKAATAKTPGTQGGDPGSVPFMAQVSYSPKMPAQRQENAKAPLIPNSLSLPRHGLTSQDGSSGKPFMAHPSPRRTMSEVSSVASSGDVSPFPSSGNVLAMAAAFDEEVRKLSPAHVRPPPMSPGPRQASWAAANVQVGNKPPQHIPKLNFSSPKVASGNAVMSIHESFVKRGQSENSSVSDRAPLESEYNRSTPVIASGICGRSNSMNSPLHPSSSVQNGTPASSQMSTSYVHHKSDENSRSEEKTKRTTAVPAQAPPSHTSKQKSILGGLGAEELEVTIDPDLLASFELEVERFTNSKWSSIERSDGETLSISGTQEDDENSAEDDSSTLPIDDTTTTTKGNKIVELGTEGSSKTIKLESSSSSSSSTKAPLQVKEVKRVKKPDPLESFEANCPPGGEERVVLYTTTLRGIRKTFEDCNHVRFILQSLGVSIDERDVSLHAEFRQELKELADKPLAVPRVFIMGRYIGGAEEVSQLHDDGTLAVLVEGLPSQTSREGCDGCGGVRFVPCSDCNGSCKLITDMNEVIRCPECNENGLMRCPICD